MAKHAGRSAAPYRGAYSSERETKRMNIFYLDKCPINAATMQCDKHVVKMILETAQLLSTAHRVLDGDERADTMGLYKTTHKNHPSAVWVRSGALNYIWTARHLNALCSEYTKRYGKVHKTERLLTKLALLPNNIERTSKMYEPPMCMPDQYKQENCAVTAYRNYYKGDKAYMCKWNKCANSGPGWFYA